ncbi:MULTISPECIES: hypothetical protein [unclassified Haladaptatus]|nr:MULTISPECIES: hypothetical protein [unclassified Haladaptatus]
MATQLRTHLVALGRELQGTSGYRHQQREAVTLSSRRSLAQSEGLDSR